MMDWKIEYLEKDGIVYAKTSGAMDWDSTKTFAKELSVFAKRHGSHRFIVDQRGITSPLTMLQIDSLPKTLKKMGATAKDRVAVVFSPKTKMDNMFKFFANSAILESLNVKLFADIDKATAWLKSDGPAVSPPCAE